MQRFDIGNAVLWAAYEKSDRKRRRRWKDL
jgi:hypothetical protein